MLSKFLSASLVLFALAGVSNAQQTSSPVFGATFGGGGSGGGGGVSKSITLENVFAGPGSFTFAHNLSSIFYQAHCWTRAGAAYAAASVSDFPVDTNDATVTVPAAGDYICSFSAVTGLSSNFSIATNPTTLTYWPTMSGAQQPTFTITQAAIAGYSGTVAYATSGLASGMSGVFSPTSITGAGSNVLTLSFPANQAAATTAFTVSGTDGTLTHTANPSITVGNINSGLVECWPLTDGSGSTLASGCGTSNTETLATGSFTWASNAGLPGTTPTFSSTAYTTGANQTATNFNGSTPFSVSAWANISAATGAITFASTLDTASNFIGWEFSSDTPGAGPRNLQTFIINTFPSNSIEVGTSTAISTGLHYVVMTYDGSKTAAGVKFYIDGVLSTNAAAVEDSLTATTANTKAVSLGGRTNGTDPINGLMAYVRIYNRVLSSSDVSNYFAAGAR